MKRLCTYCKGKTIMFFRKGQDPGYIICPHYEEPGHKTAEEINTLIQQVQLTIKPSGRYAQVS